MYFHSGLEIVNTIEYKSFSQNIELLFFNLRKTKVFEMYFGSKENI